MLKRFLSIILALFCSFAAYARDPVYTQEKLKDGRMAITCPTDDDALILLNDYNLPDEFVLIVLVKGISFEEPELNKILTDKLYLLNGTKLTHAKDYGYAHGLTILNTQFFTVNRSTEYYIFFNVELNPIVSMSRQLGIENSEADKYAATILLVTDKNMNPIK